MSYGMTDGGVVLVDGIGDRRGIGGSGLDRHVWPEDKRVVAIDLALEVEINTLIIGPGDGRRGIRRGVRAVRGGWDEFGGQALLVGCDVGEIIEVAAVGFVFWPPVIVVVSSPGPHRSNPRAALVRRGTGAASTASSAAGRAQDILDRKILFVDVVALSECGYLLVIVEVVEIETFVIVLVGADARDGPAEIAYSFIFFRDDIECLDPVAVVDAGEFALIVEVVEDLVSFYDIGGDITGGQFGIIVEESFAVDQHAGYGFSLGDDIAAGVHFHAR